MTTDIFIVSFPRDYDWLYYCLRAIRKFVSGYRSIHVALPENVSRPQYEMPDVIVHNDIPLDIGYIGQQITKMRSYQQSAADFFAFIDSDHICCEPVDLSEYFVGDIPAIYCRLWSELPQADDKHTLAATNHALVWKNPCENALGFPCPWFALELLPVFFHRETLEACCDHIESVHGESLESYSNKISYPGFSEFIALGNYALRYEPERYVRRPPPSHFKFIGYAPYFGLPDEVRDKLETVTA